MSTDNLKSKRRADLGFRTLAFLLVLFGSVTVLVPVAYVITNSLSSKESIKTVPQSLVPKETYKIDIDGTPSFVYNLTVDGQKKQLAVVKKGGETWTYAEPGDLTKTYQLPAAAPELRATKVVVHTENFATALTKAPFGQYILNTLFIVVLAAAGTVASSLLVAFGFARFRAPGMSLMFLILLGTIMLPSQVTLIPTFILFQKIGWYNTWLPLIVPAFFANAWDVFLIRQFLMGLPLELDEAAKIDGCGPFRTLWHVILPQSVPVMLTVLLFTIIYVWNDFFTPLIYLQDPKLYTVAVGLESFNALYFQQAHLQAAGALMMLVPPVILFFLAQKYFIQGTVVSGVKG
jgi:multiple sugar transport system permease protein